MFHHHWSSFLITSVQSFSIFSLCWTQSLDRNVSEFGIIFSYKWIPCDQGITRLHHADGGDAIQIRRIAVNILNKQSQTADKGWHPAWVFDGRLITPHTKRNHHVTTCYIGPRNRRGLVNTVMNLRVPQEAENLLTTWATISFSRRTLLHVGKVS
jgi:hypothetical protein